MSNELFFSIIGFAMGYFWAMWRKDNIKVVTQIKVTKGFITACVLANQAWEMERQLSELRSQIEKEESIDVQATVKAD